MGHDSPTSSFADTSTALIERAVSITTLAACRAAELFDLPVHSSLKADGSLLTAADREVEDILHTGLSEALPHAYFFGEESVENSTINPEHVYSHPALWAVDAIDGTRNFHCGFPIFGVSVGLLKIENGVLIPESGIVAFPRLNQIFFVRDGQVFRRNLQGGEEIQLPRPDDLTTPFTNGVTYVQSFNIHRDGVKHIRLTGCNAFDIVYAALRGQGTSTKGALWDYAGSLAIARAFGMKIFDAENGEERTGFTLEDFKTPTWRLKKRHIVCFAEQFEQFQKLFLIRS